MKMKKLLIQAILASCAMFAVAGCNGTKVGGSNIIQVKSYKAGYSTDFLHEAAKKFHEVYPDYSVEILDESALVDGEKVAAEIGVPKKNQTDLYFTADIDINHLIKRSSTVLHKRDVTLLESLDDVFESKGITLEGKEENETIKSRFFDGFEELCKYEGEVPQWRGKMFTLPWAEAITGLFVNKAVLDKYSLAIPLTSNELIHVVEEVYRQGKASDNYPFSFGGGNAAGYWQYLYETWFAQYSGVQGFNNFMNCDPGNGKIVDEGYKVYADRGILKALEPMFEICDLNYCPNGSLSKTHMEAQTEFINGRSAFMVDGDWLLNEMKEYYFDKAKEIMMIGAPILSSIGEQIGINDNQLHSLVEYIDSHKTNDQIKTLMPSLTDEHINWVRDARSVHSTRGIAHNVVIPSYADAKDAAKLFLRFLYSNDGCRIFRNYANSNFPLSYERLPGDSNTTFQQSLDKVRDYENPQVVTTVAPFNGVRKNANMGATREMYVFNLSSWQFPKTFYFIMLDKKSDDPQFSAQTIYEQEAAYAEENWKEWMRDILYL